MNPRTARQRVSRFALLAAAALLPACAPYTSTVAPSHRPDSNRALLGLRDRFWKIVAAHKLVNSAVKEASLLFRFSEGRSDDYVRGNRSGHGLE